MVKTNYAAMNYEELEAEKQKVSAAISGLKTTKRELAALMDTKLGEARLQKVADNLSPEDKSKLKEIL